MLSTLILFRENCQLLCILSLYMSTQARAATPMDHHCEYEGQPLVSHQPLDHWPKTSTLSGEGADVSTSSKLSPADSPLLLDSVLDDSPTPCLVSQVHSHPFPPQSLGQAPFPTGASEICSFPLAHTHPALKLAPPRRPLLRALPSRPGPSPRIPGPPRHGPPTQTKGGSGRALLC